MSELTGKQKRFLRGLGQRLSPMAVVDKGEAWDRAVGNVVRLLADHELVKIKLPEGPVRKEVAAELAAAVDAACIGVVGRTALLYRPSEQLAPDKRIRLP